LASLIGVRRKEGDVFEGALSIKVDS